MKRPIRVLIADDSAFVRKVLRQVLEGQSDIEVAGVARDGYEALEKCQTLRPDVMVLDLVMPNLDGFGVLAGLAGQTLPRVVVLSTSDVKSVTALTALQHGALEVLHKPTATAELYALGEELLLKVRAAATARPQPPSPPVKHIVFPQSPHPCNFDLMVIGTSTGGPGALTRLLPMLPRNFPVPIAIALHIPAGYTHAMAARLNETTEIEVMEAADAMVIPPGCAALAPGGMHLLVNRRQGDVIAQVRQEPKLPLIPSVDLLFTSAAEAFGGRTLAVVLTGMGEDGLKGARALVAAGSKVITEAESSCVVYGMPRAVYEAGLASTEASLEHMAFAFMEYL